MRFTFQKEEKLTGLKVFTELAAKGNSFFVHPFRIIWMHSQEEQHFPARIAFAVPKRNFKKAVDRNRIKRLLRETYRHHKHELYETLNSKDVKISVMFIYTAKEKPDHAGLERKIILSLQRLSKAAESDGRTG
ncbi:MAG: ribonuclease protein component [Bacteroidota bacterium]|jgi:ribonuclease P protein component